MSLIAPGLNNDCHFHMPLLPIWLVSGKITIRLEDCRNSGSLVNFDDLFNRQLKAQIILNILKFDKVFEYGDFFA